MRYFIDTEFISSSRSIDLVSIGIVCEDGREYYAISTEFDFKKASQRVKDNVLSKLPPKDVNPVYESPRLREESRAWKSLLEIKQEISQFITEAPEFWGDCSGFDYVLFCQLMSLTECAGDCNILNLFGLLKFKSYNPIMENYPAGYPYYFNDIQQWRDQLGSPSLPEEPSEAHHALIDARWIRDAWKFLQAYEKSIDLGQNLPNPKYPMTW